jgi:glycosyltransferase involved in cell wall biosynthesis
MRILICAVEAPLPPVNGFRLMLAALTKELRSEHDVRVLAFVAPDQETVGSHDPGLRLVPRPEAARLGDAAALVQALVRRRPLRADAMAALLARPLREELEAFDPDVVHVTSGRLAALGRALTGRRSVLGALDAWHLNVEARALVAAGARRRLLRGEAARVRRFEASEYRRFGRVVVVSEADRDALREVDPMLAVSVIPNGVDAGYFAPDPNAVRDSSRIVFTGVMSYAPNVLAADFLAREVFPLVRAARPGARLAIVGRAPAPRVRALAELGGVEVTGEVEDLRPWLAGSGVYVCPMISGTGIKNKLLEAMACAAGCVATPLALQGLRATAGRELLVGTTAQELADGLLRVLGDDECRERLGHAARRYVLREHDWGSVAHAYHDVYRELQANRVRAAT